MTTETEHKLGVDTVREAVKRLCAREGARRAVERMAFETERGKVEKKLRQTEEIKRMVEDGEDPFPSGRETEETGTEEALTHLKIEGMRLREDELLSLKHLLEDVKRVKDYVAEHGERRGMESVAETREMTDGMVENGEARRTIENVIDERGEVRDDASEELRRLRREKERERSRVSGVMAEALRNARKNGWVDEDARVSVRDGRGVIPVKATHKGEVRGIVHDASASGGTFYIEPDAAVEVNNRVREVEAAEREEVNRILTEVTERLRPKRREMEHAAWVMDELDFWRAKAEWAVRHRGERMKLSGAKTAAVMDFREARHPLLEEKVGKVVPMNLRMSEERHVLLISGPNAGGKSVCLKTVGLLQWLTQCGMLVPVEKGSVTRMFKDVMVDIGDEQSIENSLSTYSSHLTKMKTIAKEGDANTMVLIDEMGSGTEPRMGGAIAEALLEHFRKKKMWCVVTTHYDNLKHWAADAEGVMNAAMAYDRGALKPLFELQVGSAGSSFAVEIARKIGLPEDVVQDAVNRAGDAVVNYDKHLQEVARDKRYWMEKREQARRKNKRAEEMEAELEQKLKETDKERKSMIREAKEEARRIVEEANARIERVIREIKESKAEKEKTKEVRAELSQYVAEKLRVEKKKETKEKAAETEDGAIEVGDRVRLKESNSVGLVVNLNGDVAEIEAGHMRMRMKTSGLTRVSKNEAKRLMKTDRLTHKVSANSAVENMKRHRGGFSTTLDIRGERVVEGMAMVERYMDDAVMLNAGVVRILHGTGTGALKSAVREYLKGLKGVKAFRDEDVQLGGAGITVVEL